MTNVAAVERNLPSSISRIRSDGVLGEFAYDVDFSETSHESERVVIIYAENGMGKTNFLKAVNHLLSPRVDSLGALADLLVDDLSITLDNGTEVSLSKSTDSESLFRCRLTIPAEPEAEAEAEVQFVRHELTVTQNDIEGRALRHSSLRPEVTIYLRALGRAVSPTIFVGDDRLVYSSNDVSTSVTNRRAFEPERESMRHRPRQQSIREALDRVERFFTRITLAGISRESRGASDGVYSDITRRVLAGTKNQVSSSDARMSLSDKAEALLNSASEYEKYGMLLFTELRQIFDQISSARINNRYFPALQGILGPYLADLERRVEALAPAQRIIDTFVSSVNSFLERKSLVFSAGEGIRLLGRSGEELEPDGLSSGEKHLLLLLSNAVLARQTGALVIIDEPELSLGLRWQRQLISELVRCTADSGVQFLVASHSVQIMGDVDEVVRPTEVASHG